MPAYMIDIENLPETGKRVVRASTAAQALRHVWRQTTTVEALNSDQLMRALMDDGLKMEDARSVEAEDAKPPTAVGETYAHKLACPADSSVPIGKANCMCMSLDS